MSSAADRLTKEARDRIGKNWSKSKLTREKLLQNIRTIATYMAHQGLQHIDHMKTKHVTRYFDMQKARGLSASTLQNMATAMRVLANSIGKPGIVPEKNRDLGISRHNRYQPLHANLEKLSNIRQQLALRDERLVAAFDMRAAFGLRAKESLLSNHIIERDGKQYLAVAGAKGGRPRQIAIETEQQRSALAAVHHIMATQQSSSLIPPDKDLKTYYHYQKNTLSALGARRSDGSNMHSLRHLYAQTEQAAGKTDAEVQKALGHGEERTLQHYVD